MSVLCVLGHAWYGCTCRRCGAPRNHALEGCVCFHCGATVHDLDGCTCRRCGANVHTLDGCVCQRCGTPEHDWYGCTCRRCTAVRDHTWDGCTCRRCGHSRHDWADCKCRRCGVIDVAAQLNTAPGRAQEFVTWARRFNSPAIAWRNCERPDWMLALCSHMVGKDGWPTRQQVVLAACECAATVLEIIPTGEERPRQAVKAARRWVKGDASIAQVRDAVEAALEYHGAAIDAITDACRFAPSFEKAEAVKTANKPLLPASLAAANAAREVYQSDSASWSVSEAADAFFAQVQSAGAIRYSDVDVYINDASRDRKLKEFADLIRPMLPVPFMSRPAASPNDQKRTADLEEKNLKAWRETGHPERWVKEKGFSWNHEQWSSLIQELRHSNFWPMNEDQVGLVLERTREAMRRS